MLGAHGHESRVALKASLDQEEGAAGSGSEDPGRSTTKHIDREALGVDVVVQKASEGAAHGIVET